MCCCLLIEQLLLSKLRFKFVFFRIVIVATVHVTMVTVAKVSTPVFVNIISNAAKLITVLPSRGYITMFIHTSVRVAL